MTEKSDDKIEISDSLDIGESNRDDDPTPSVSDSVQVKVDLEKSKSSVNKKVNHNPASGETASPKTITLKSMDFAAFLPQELTDIIFSHLSSDDLEYCRSVSELWSRMTNNFIRRQRIQLRNNWENGKYSVHCLEIDEQMEFVEMIDVALLPSTVPHVQDFHYPLIMYKKGTSDSYGFYLIRIDATLRMTSELILTLNYPEKSIQKVCVMRDSLVWINKDGLVQWYDGKLAPDSRVKNIDSLNDVDEGYSITMDPVNIALWTNWGCLRVWCKQTNELKLNFQPPPFNYLHCSLFDGCLIISTGKYRGGNPGRTSKIEIYNLRNDAPNYSNMHQQTFLVDGAVKILNSNERFIFLNMRTYNDSYIQVRDKLSYDITYRFSYDNSEFFTISNVCDDFIVLKNHINSYKILILASGEWFTASPDTKRLYTLFENISISINFSDSTLHVSDWRRHAQLYNLTNTEQICNRDHVVLGITESMIVTFNVCDKFIVYKFD